MKKNLLILLYIIVLVLVVTKSYFKVGFPYTHDGENHLARFANYKIALREGQMPPRFAPNLMNHYGYPVFNYNYPLANILSSPFSFLKVNYEISFKLIVIGSALFGILGAYLWLSSFKFSKQSKLFAIGVYALSPYLISLINFRGNIGEIMAYSLLPYLFLVIENIIKNKFGKYELIFSSAIFGLFFLSHNVSVMFGSALLLIYALIRFDKETGHYLSLFKSLITGFCLSAWFWLPAILEKNLIVLDNASISNEFLQHFVTLKQIFISPISFGFSQISSVDSLGFSLGITQGLILLFALCSFVLLKIKDQRLKNAHLAQIIFLLVITLILAQMPLSKSVWQILPLVKYIQFPWRLTMFVAVLNPFLAAWTFEILSKSWRQFLLAILAIQAIIFVRIKPVDYFHKNIVDYDAFSQSTSTNNENLPKTFVYSDIADWQPGPKILEGNGEISVESWNGSSRIYLLNLNEKSLIAEPTANYLGWETYVLKEKIWSKVVYADNEEIAGRIAYWLDQGEYQIKSKFTQRTKFRLLGNIISLASLIGLFILLIKNTRSNHE